MSKISKTLKSPMVPWAIIMVSAALLLGIMIGWNLHVTTITDAKADIVLKDQKQR